MYIKANGVDITYPNSITKISINNETLWSANAGRSPESGYMTGDIVAKKRTVALEWTMLTKAQADTIITELSRYSFFTVVVSLNGTAYDINGSFYRGTIQREISGCHGGIWYVKSLTVELIEQ